MRIVILLITLLISSQTFVMAGSIESLPEEMKKARPIKYNKVWNDLTIKYMKFLVDRNSWKHCTNVIGFKPEGIYRRTVVCYTEEEGSLFEKHDLMIDKRIHAVMEKSMKRLWHAADAVDYGLILQKGDKFIDSAYRKMLDNKDYYENVALPEVMMEVFNELNEKEKARLIALEKSISQPKKIIKKKPNKTSSKSLLKKLLGAN